MMPINHYFGRIDLQEAYDLFGLVEVDYDETYPHQTAKLDAWMREWSPYITGAPLAIQEGNNIRIILDKHSSLLCITHAQRQIVVTATTVLLNLTRPYVSLRDQTSLNHILKNIFSTFILVSQ